MIANADELAAAEPTVAMPTDSRGQVSWALVEFARNPYVSLVFMFVFAPYFASTVVGDPIRGQEIWSLSYTVAGFCIAILAPILGAVVDRLGRRKPWVVGSVGLMVPACFALWYAMPAGMGGLPIWAIACLVIILMIGFESGAVAHNAMLPSIASGAQIGRLSGLGLASGATGSVTAQIVVLFGIVFPAAQEVSWAFLPDKPLFGLDPATFEHARIVGPISAVWMLVFIVPFMLWTPDLPATGISAGRAIREGLLQLRATLRHARQMSNVSTFLAARMLYNDGMIAIQAYCGIYAAGVFGWSLATIMVFALILAVFCILGGIVGGKLDARFGSRRAIIISLACSAVAVLVAISVTPTRIFFIPYDAAAVGPVWSFPYFRTWPEIIYVSMYIVLAVTITAIIANSRALMARIAPLRMMSQFFGLYALSGTATAFLGHGMVALFTGLFHSQRAGFASLLILICAGLVLVSRVREERAIAMA
ncbi:MAG TPA: MFS transporter [Steroidobacteraceae bacterium]|nr:MFS transporter [Steroidobacteraceae bacterium]